MPRRVHYRERVDQPQGAVGAADVFGLRVTFLHTPSMGAIETGSGLRRNGVLGAGASIESMGGGEAAYRFTGGQASGACSFGVARATRSSGSFVTLVRFRLNVMGDAKPFSCWGSNGNFLTATSPAGEITTACGDAVNGSIYARATSGLGLQAGVVYTVALGYVGGNPPAFTGAVNGRPLTFPTSVVAIGDASLLRDSAVRTTQIGIADDGNPMNGFASIAGVLIGRHTQAMLNTISANPWMVAELARRNLNPVAAITVYRPGSDVGISGWTAVGAATRAAALADESGATYAESPDLSTPDTQTWITPFPAGPVSLEVTAARTDTAGALRIVFLDAGGAAVGATAWQTLTGTPTDYTLTATVSAVSPQFRIEVQP